MFEFTRFITRSPMYALKNWRGLSKTRKVMNEHRKVHPHCEFCGRIKAIEVHHLVPVSVNPILVDDPDNFISLCRKHHLQVGHNGDFGGRYCTNVEIICGINKVVKISG